MRFIFIALCLLLTSACGKPDTDPPKIGESQREALEKARGVEQTLAEGSRGNAQKDR